MFYVFFKVVDKAIGNRVSAETEIVGLDLPEMGALAYPEFSLTTAAPPPTRGRGRELTRSDRDPAARRGCGAPPRCPDRYQGVNRL